MTYSTIHKTNGNPITFNLQPLKRPMDSCKAYSDSAGLLPPAAESEPLGCARPCGPEHLEGEDVLRAYDLA